MIFCFSSLSALSSVSLLFSPFSQTSFLFFSPNILEKESYLFDTCRISTSIDVLLTESLFSFLFYASSMPPSFLSLFSHVFSLFLSYYSEIERYLFNLGESFIDVLLNLSFASLHLPCLFFSRFSLPFLRLLFSFPLPP